jgi:hypothetical protein
MEVINMPGTYDREDMLIELRGELEKATDNLAAEINAHKQTANLIAAAPDLLEACKQTWHYIHACKRPGDGDRDNPSYTINIVEKCLSAAIAKAQGGA